MYTAGYSDIENKLPMDSSYTFRIASNTKTFTGTVLLQLVGEGNALAQLAVEAEPKVENWSRLFAEGDPLLVADAVRSWRQFAGRRRQRGARGGRGYRLTRTPREPRASLQDRSFFAGRDSAGQEAAIA